MISAGPSLIVKESKLPRKRISHVHRAQEPLRIAMHCQDVVAFALSQQALECLPLALQPVNGPRLFSVLIDSQHDAAIQELFIYFNGRRSQQDHHRTFNPVLNV